LTFVLGYRSSRWEQSDGYLPVPDVVDCEKFIEEFGGFMIGEDLAYFSDQNSPRDTTKIAHTIGADASVLGPSLNHSQSLFEIFSLFPCQFQNHQVIFPTNE